ncbi:type 1 glutamine amidotransferase family protein [Sphingobacterium paludis]|nr:hypothetical protein [Sphingobacterium paludis]
MFTQKSTLLHVWACLLLLGVSSCRKQGDGTLDKANSDTQLMFTIAEQTGEPGSNMMKLKASSSSSAMQVQPESQEEYKEFHFIDDGAFRVTTSIVNEPSTLSANDPLETNKLDARMSGPQKASSRSLLARNIKYRVVLYDRSTTPSTFVSTTLGTAGSPLYINVEKGKNYDWAVFSFNDENDPGDMQDVVNTGSRDLLHAKGTTGVIPGVSGDRKLYTVPIHVQLQHKLANVSVQVTAKNYPARITGISGILGRNSYFFRNKLDIKTGNFVDQHTHIAMSSTMAFSSVSGETDRVADYYTSSSSPISNFFIQLNTLSLRTPSNDIRTLSSPVQYRWNNISPVAGQRTIAKINIQPVQDISGDRFRILSVGSAHHSLDPYSNYSGSWHALHSDKNFGPTGTYPTTNLNWSINYTPNPVTAYSSDLSSYKMIFVAVGGAPARREDAQKLIDYVQQGGTLIWFTATPLHAFDKIVWEHFAGQGTTLPVFTTDGSKLSQHDVLNGVFGDARGKTFGNYAAGGLGMSDFTKPVDVLAEGIPVRPATSSAVVWKARDYNFFYFATNGMQKYAQNAAEIAAGVAPFLLTSRPDYVPTIGPWGKQQDVSNSVLLMNVVAQTIDRVMSGRK